MNIVNRLTYVFLLILIGCGTTETQEKEESPDGLGQLSEEAREMELKEEEKDSIHTAILVKANEIIRADEAEEAVDEVTEECGCAPATFAVKSKHSWAEFRLPQRNKKQVIKIRKGSYNRFVFPKNYRVFWSDLLFRCNESTCEWQRVSGNWGKDNTLEVTPLTNGPYAFTGDRNL